MMVSSQEGECLNTSCNPYEWCNIKASGMHNATAHLKQTLQLRVNLRDILIEP